MCEALSVPHTAAVQTMGACSSLEKTRTTHAILALSDWHTWKTWLPMSRNVLALACAIKVRTCTGVRALPMDAAFIACQFARPCAYGSSEQHLCVGVANSGR